MRFINKRNGVILEPRNRTVEEQLRKSVEYTLYEPKTAVEGAEKALSKMTKAELLEAAKAAGIDVPDDATKAQLVELVKTQGER